MLGEVCVHRGKLFNLNDTLRICTRIIHRCKRFLLLLIIHSPIIDRKFNLILKKIMALSNGIILSIWFVFIAISYASGNTYHPNFNVKKKIMFQNCFYSSSETNIVKDI